MFISSSVSRISRWNGTSTLLSETWEFVFLFSFAPLCDCIIRRPRVNRIFVFRAISRRPRWKNAVQFFLAISFSSLYLSLCRFIFRSVSRGRKKKVAIVVRKTSWSLLCFDQTIRALGRANGHLERLPSVKWTFARHGVQSALVHETPFLRVILSPFLRAPVLSSLPLL